MSFITMWFPGIEPATIALPTDQQEHKALMHIQYIYEFISFLGDVSLFMWLHQM